MDDYKPDSETFAADVERAAQAEWLLKRNLERYNELEQQLSAQGGPLLWTEEEHRLMERFLRYKAAAERQFYRARQAVEQRRRNRLYEAWGQEKRNEQRKKQAREEAEVEAPAEESQEKAAMPLQWPPLIQHFRIHLVDGQMVSTRNPKEEELRRVALRFDPPRKIRRWLSFEDGVPAEYSWIPEAEHRGEREFGYSYDLMFEEWAAMEKRETESGTGHAGPKPTGDQGQ
jgi:hypothetical protein